METKPVKVNRSGKVGRPNKVLQEQRLMEVVDLLLQVKPRKEIYQYVYDNYGVGQKSTDYLITEAYKVIKEKYSVDREGVVNQHIQKYYDIVNKCDGYDPKHQIQALQAIEKLLKLHQPDVAIQQNTLELDVKHLSLEEIKELLGKDQ